MAWWLESDDAHKTIELKTNLSPTSRSCFDEALPCASRPLIIGCPARVGSQRNEPHLYSKL